MIPTTTELISASRALDPASRALLNLWLHRGLDDKAIAHLAGGSAEEVAERRRKLVELLAEAVQAPREEVLAALDGLSVRPEVEVEPAVPPAARAEVEVEPAVLRVPGRGNGRAERVPRPPPGSPERPSPFPASLAVALGAIVVLVVLVARLGGGPGEGGSGEPPPTPTPTPEAAAPPPPAAPVPLEAVTGSAAGVQGTLAARGDRIRLAVTGLDRPASDYEVWLFNSVADSTSLGRLDRGRFRLPPDRGRFRYLEVSLEPRGEDAPVHSGRTVLRTRVPPSG